jgi:sugar O-acyltransferase (sialic acid O-acetyltransferase NeuD family)
MPEAMTVVFGAGGHGKVVADMLLLRGVTVAGFVDDRAERTSSRIMGLPVLGNRDWLRRQAAAGPLAVALGIGTNNHGRREAAEFTRSCGAQLLTVVHPAAVVSPHAHLGPGTVVMAGAVINAEAHVGTGVVVNSGAVVEHDVIVEDFAFLAPNCSIGGAGRVGELALIGLGAVLLPLVSVGAETKIGAGAVVLRDIPAGVIASGVPATVRLEKTVGAGN